MQNFRTNTLIASFLIDVLLSPDALHLSIPAQGLPNGDAALPHAAYPGMQPYPGVGKCISINVTLLLISFFFFKLYIYYMFIGHFNIVLTGHLFSLYSTSYTLCLVVQYQHQYKYFCSNFFCFVFNYPNTIYIYLIFLHVTMSIFCRSICQKLFRYSIYHNCYFLVFLL